MCIRDRTVVVRRDLVRQAGRGAVAGRRGRDPGGFEQRQACLLYTSDAADERSSVDLGGRRILKKKQRKKHTVGSRGMSITRTIYRRVRTHEQE